MMRCLRGLGIKPVRGKFETSLGNAMANQDLVSIIMPTYECERFICESIKSVQAQTYQNWELIVVIL